MTRTERLHQESLQCVTALSQQNMRQLHKPQLVGSSQHHETGAHCIRPASKLMRIREKKTSIRSFKHNYNIRTPTDALNCKLARKQMNNRTHH